MYNVNSKKNKKWTEEVLNELKKDILNFSIEQLEKKYEIKYCTIKQVCKTFKIDISLLKKVKKDRKVKKYFKLKNMENEFINDWQEGILSIQEMSKKYECPKGALKSRAQKLNIKRTTAKDKIKIDEIIDKYNTGDSINKLAKENNICYTTLRKIFQENNVLIRDSSERCKKIEKDENYFNELNSQNKLYILGLLYADGYNNEKRNSINLSLKEEDKYILEKIKEELKFEGKIKQVINKQYNKIYSVLTIINKKLSIRLAQLGIVQNKSLIITYPDFLINDETFKHFLRGYIDGDGCITCYKRKNRYCFSIIICGTYDFLFNIQKKLIKLFNINKTKINKRKNIYILNISQKDKVEKILDWLYLDAELYLKRKYNTYIKIKEINKLYPNKYKMIYYNYLADKESKLKNEKFAFLGISFELKERLKDIIIKYGGRISYISGHPKYILIGKVNIMSESEKNKLEKVKKLGSKIITEEEFLEMIK